MSTMNARSKKQKGRASGAPIAVVEKTTRVFGGRTVLRDIQLTVLGGEMLGVVGPNGGGKSTLLLLMAGLLSPTSGTVTVCGKDAHLLSRTASGAVGLVTARPGLYPLLTGRENLRHFGGLFGFSAKETDEKAAPSANALGMTPYLEERVAHMSTGMQQKLSLIRALLPAPSLLLFDEPTANLDPIASQILYNEVRRRADDGLACVLVTHDLTAAESLCDRIVLVDGAVKKELRFKERRALQAGPLLDAWQKEIGGR